MAYLVNFTNTSEINKLLQKLFNKEQMSYTQRLELMCLIFKDKVIYWKITDHSISQIGNKFLSFHFLQKDCDIFYHVN